MRKGYAAMLGLALAAGVARHQCPMYLRGLTWSLCCRPDLSEGVASPSLIVQHRGWPNWSAGCQATAAAAAASTPPFPFSRRCTDSARACSTSSGAVRGPSSSMHAVHVANCTITNLDECRALLGHDGRNISVADRCPMCAVGGHVSPSRTVLATTSDIRGTPEVRGVGIGPPES